ncbi:MAG: sugar (pentulose or hexulose) kinase [Granulosicoccus sp.]|jgi:sugar (pentulose or hexulose) kinase
MSATQPCVLGIDVGTSGVRAIAVDRNGDALTMSRHLYTDIAFDKKDTQTYRSTTLWWQAVELAIDAVMSELNDYSVVALSVDGTSGSVLPIDAQGTPIAIPLMYNDAVDDQSILDAIARSMPSFSAAGGATSGLAKVLHFAPLKPFAVVHQADWIVGQLCGCYTHSDANNALKTGFDPIEMIWPAWISDVADVLPLLPNVSVPGEPVATVSAAIANRFGLSSSVKIIAGTTDGCASFLATGASQVGEAVTALGSTMTLKLLSDKAIFAPEYGVYSHRIGKLWLAGGASNTGGAVLSHYFTNAQMEQHSSNMKTDLKTGLNYYPLLVAGERFPVNDPNLEPRLHPRPTSDQTFFQGILEGIAAIEKTGYDKLAQVGGPDIKSVRTVGGGAANAAFSRIRKSQLAVDFKTPLSEEAAFGVASLALSAADELSLW